ncbi:MAG: RIP metalloprotease RseP [Aggregatilineales bacterium]
MFEFLLQNDFLSAIIAFAMILIPAIIIHELGHFFAAKMVGINVLEFGVGFPPRMFRLFMWGETEFTLNWLPLGGFVRPLGEDMLGPVDTTYPDEEGDDPEKPKNENYYISEREELLARGVPEHKMMSVNEASPMGRIWFMFAGPLANFITAIILFAVIAMIGLPEFEGARLQITALEDNSIFAGTDVDVNDAIEKVNGGFFIDAQDFVTQLTALKGQRVTLTMLDVENNDNYDVIVTIRTEDSQGYVFIQGVAEDSPAHEAGIEPGDLVTAINGQQFSINNPMGQIGNIIGQYPGQQITLSILRGSQRFDLDVVPRTDPPPGEGRLGVIIEARYGTNDGAIFVDAPPQQKLVPQPPVTAIEYGFSQTFGVVSAIVSIPAQMIEGAISPEEARPVSIIGISQVGGQILQRSIQDGTPIPILNFIALVSIFLGFSNLLPIPPLDGGRILFVLIEIVRGKPVPIQVENMIYRIGMVIMLGLAVIVIFYDIFNPFVLPS